MSLKFYPHRRSGTKIDSGEHRKIDSDFERLIIQMEEARFSSDEALMDAQTSEFLVSLRIDKVEEP